MKIAAILICFLVMLSLSACATTGLYDGFKNSHRACYAYIYGNENVNIDNKKAFKWCSAGDAEGYLSSTTLLAEIFYQGRGTRQDVPKATHLYEKAAAGGHTHAQLMMYLIYNDEFKNISTQKQKELGLMYLKKSAESGNEKAITVLSREPWST